ncbi:putative nodulin homeobox protein [Helianthus annuus]|nr:putative nodulin homeobox protein [Helianthus annuus]
MQQLDLKSAVEKLHVLSSKDLGKLIRDAKNGIIKQTINGSFFEVGRFYSDYNFNHLNYLFINNYFADCLFVNVMNILMFQINVENLGRPLVQHIMIDTVSLLKPDEQHFKYLLSGLKLLHTLCDIASHHSTLARVFVEDMNVQHEMLNSIFRMIHVLSQLGEKINGLSQMVMYSALLSNSMYLLKALISSEWKDVADVLLAHPEVGDFAIAAVTAIRVSINHLRAKPTTQRVNSRMQPNDEVYCLFHLCESSVQFIQSLCMQMLFRERLVENKVN